jgi:hypothetical protein
MAVSLALVFSLGRQCYRTILMTCFYPIILTIIFTKVFITRSQITDLVACSNQQFSLFIFLFKTQKIFLSFKFIMFCSFKVCLLGGLEKTWLASRCQFDPGRSQIFGIHFPLARSASDQRN